MVYFLLSIYIVVLILTCIRVILHTTTPSKGLAYLLLIIGFPIVGIIIYLSIGLNYRKTKLYGKKIKIDYHSYPQLKERSLSYTQNILKKHKDSLGDFYPLANFRIEHGLLSDNNNAALLINGENTFPEIVKSLKAAKHHIHLEYYIYENDNIGNEIANILIAKANQGVKIRFIYDDFGSRGIVNNIIKKLKNNNIEAYAFNKLNIVQLANRINYRNHRKIIIIDGIVGFIGGINISDKYANNKNSSLFWRDTHLKIEGNAVMNLQFTFLTDWNFCAKQNIEFSSTYFPFTKITQQTGNKLMQIVASGPDSDYPSIMYSLIQIILLAKKDILITTPYLIPNNSFLNALKIAALSNVDIKILVPDKSDSAIVGLTTKSFYQELLESGIKIYKYTKGFVHAKTLVCDGFVSNIGTTNLDNRSFDLNFEINAIVFDKEIATQLEQQFYKDIENAEEILLKDWNKRPFFNKFIEKVLYLFSSLM